MKLEPRLSLKKQLVFATALIITLFVFYAYILPVCRSSSQTNLHFHVEVGHPNEGLDIDVEIQQLSIHQNWIRLPVARQFRAELLSRWNQTELDRRSDYPRFIIQVFGWRRFASMRRLMNSLLNSAYMGVPVDLQINIDGDAAEELVAFVNSFAWPFGEKILNVRQGRLGLEKVSNHHVAWMEDDYVCLESCVR